MTIFLIGLIIPKLHSGCFLTHSVQAVFWSILLYYAGTGVAFSPTDWHALVQVRELSNCSPFFSITADYKFTARVCKD